MKVYTFFSTIIILKSFNGNWRTLKKDTNVITVQENLKCNDVM